MISATAAKDFRTLSREDKRKLVLNLLLKLQSYGDSAATLHRYVYEDRDVPEADLDEIFDNVMNSMLSLEEKDREEAVSHLAHMSDQVLAMREAEKADREKDERDGHNVLAQIV